MAGARSGRIARASDPSGRARPSRGEEGAPYEVFLSADERWIDELIGSGRLDGASRVELAQGRLVVAVQAGLAAGSARTTAASATDGVFPDGRWATGDPRLRSPGSVRQGGAGSARRVVDLVHPDDPGRQRAGGSAAGGAGRGGLGGLVPLGRGRLGPRSGFSSRSARSSTGRSVTALLRRPAPAPAPGGSSTSSPGARRPRGSRPTVSRPAPGGAASDERGCRPLASRVGDPVALPPGQPRGHAQRWRDRRGPGMAARPQGVPPASCSWTPSYTCRWC